MPFGPKKHTYKAALLAVVLVLTPLTVLATVSDEDLAQTKDKFAELWHSAAETTQRRAQLEDTLAHFDEKVQDAKKSLAEVTAARRDIRERIDKQKALITILDEQTEAIRASQDFYRSVAVNQQQDYKQFIRYLVSRNIALHEAGPAAGGSLLKQLFRGSLGDSVQDGLAETALIKTRAKFMSQITVLLGESDKALTRLTDVHAEMTDQLTALEQESKSLASVADENAAFIDDSWRQKKLTEDEIKDVAAETAESNAQVAAMQASLIKIDAELRESKTGTLKKQLEDLKKEKQQLADERDGIARKDAAMKLSQDAALKALQVTIQLRNTDPKLYKRTEEVQLHLKNIQIERDTYSGSTLGPRSNALDAEIALLKAQIALMKDGVPSDAAEDYVRKKRQADEATVLRAELKTQIDALEVKIDATDDAIKAKEKEIATAEKQSGLDGLPPLFTWPVNGTITAGYHDPDYQTVFGVPHQAIDIAVPQSTPVRTVSEGIVFTVRDGGATGYSYILVGHSNGYASLYGHVSKSFVKAGDIVTFGQIIGLSGGAPGSHGAGPMTTGSHLHLEMMKDGVHFNPLTILP